MLLARGEARGVQQFARRQGCADCHAPVDPGHLAVMRGGNRLGDRGKGDMPAPSAVHRHPAGLHPWRHRAGPAEPHPAGLRHPNFAHMAGQAVHIPSPPASPHDPESLMPPGLTPRRPPSRAPRTEKGSHRLCEVPHGLLLHHLGACGQPGILGPGYGELTALLEVARRASPARVPVPVLLDGGIPDKPGVAAVFSQHRLLGGRRKQPVPGHANTLANIADIPKEVKRRFLGLKAGSSTPRFL